MARALAVRRRYSPHARVPRPSFLRGLINGISIGYVVCPKVTLRRYPSDARSEDMVRIGADMYRAFEEFDGQEETPATATSSG